MKTLNILFTIATSFLFFAPALAQGAPPITPIDGGLSALLAAAGLYGIKKIRDSRK